MWSVELYLRLDVREREGKRVKKSRVHLVDPPLLLLTRFVEFEFLTVHVD